MAWCLTAPSHYLNQYWLIISEDLWHSPDGNFTGNDQDVYTWYEFEINNLRLHPHLPGGNEITRVKYHKQSSMEISHLDSRGRKFIIAVLTHWHLARSRCKFEYVIFKSSFVPNVSRILLPLWIMFRCMVGWCRQPASHYLNPLWPGFMTQYGADGDQWVKLICRGNIYVKWMLEDFGQSKKMVISVEKVLPRRR